MQIDRLLLEGFRNYDSQQLTFDGSCNVIYGENAQGKTNLLEAIVYLSCGRSPRTHADRELIGFDRDRARLVGHIQAREREFETEILLNRGRRRRMTVNGVAARNGGDLSQVLHTVFFSPEDLFLIREGAAARRRFMDQSLCQLRPRYAEALMEYGRLYDHKTRILRDSDEYPQLLDTLPDFNHRLCQVGAVLISYRARYVQALAVHARRAHWECSGEREDLALTYQTVKTVEDPLGPVQDIAGALEEHQAKHYQAELASRLCLSGPHKDDHRRNGQRPGGPALLLPGSGADGGPEPEAGGPGDPQKRHRRVPGDAAGRRAVGAGPPAAGVCAQPHCRRTGVHHLLRKRPAGCAAVRPGVSRSGRKGAVMGFLHIGQNVMVNDRHIIGIFDLDITSQSPRDPEVSGPGGKGQRGASGVRRHSQVVSGVRPPVSPADRVYFPAEHPDSAEKSGKEVKFFPVIAGRSAGAGFPGMTGQTQGKERSSNERTGKSHRRGHHL